MIKITRIFTDQGYKELQETWPEREELDLQEFGFCIKNLGKRDTQKLKKIEECIENQKKELGIDPDDPQVWPPKLNLPKEMKETYRKLKEKMYKDFRYIQPGYFKDTMNWAKKHNKVLSKPFPAGALMYFDYPLSCVVEVEIQNEITNSADFVQAFCEAYKEIYTLEEESSKKKAMPMYKEDPSSCLMNRNTTDGCFGIWGHDLEDLVLEVLLATEDRKYIEFFIGS